MRFAGEFNLYYHQGRVLNWLSVITVLYHWFIGYIGSKANSSRMKDLNCDSAAVFKDDKLSIGGQVKSKGEVLKEYFLVRSKPPNLNCRVERFGRICQTFDSCRRQWVSEMGFGGLLYLSSGMHLPRKLGYWLMTRIDPFNKMVITPDGRVLRLSRN
ncbi:uncharacterized protein LOC110681586 [Chenopodium quinoa]|uniref:uncharacterized protein LOC110681586 n=1 Tax=Chenopodium quinoa TaxID=63459 RepID=UPI000B7832F2|nr:uncharacterized protein LOC110681586 [Chenopodium quinoa]